MKQTLPAVPLVTCDPYFSIWSPANALYDADTCHWSEAVKRLKGLVKIDDREHRWMGMGSEPIIEQTQLEITPTATVYTFANEKVTFKATFCTPLLLSDLELVSRPVSYISFEAASADGLPHTLTVSVEVDEGHCYDGDSPKPMLGGVHHCEGFDTAWMGQKKQSPLCHSGDHITIDWGYIYLAAPTGGQVSYSKGERTVITYHHELTVGVNGSATAFVAVAYDDIASIQYFGEQRRGYWARGGQTILQAIGLAIADYSVIMSRCRVFDDGLVQDAERAGGKEYATICAAAYRQTIAAHKLTTDGDGQLLFISKECDSNGCAATVDISYPSAPLYLLYCPELVKGMLRPVFAYSKLPVWHYDFAPHDVGRYPYLWGQVYGLKEHVGEGEVHPANYIYPKGSDIFKLCDQMPVEECGNVLILTAAVLLADGDTEFARQQMSLLNKWVCYLLQYGADPGDQLCTDDFAGHLAHNANLAVKAIAGIEAYSIILAKLGQDADSRYYHSRAVEMAQSWEKRADAGDHTVLCFGDSAGWSLKYNMIWDKLFGSKLFADSTYKRETAYYLGKINRYGVPLDSRRDYTKSDWIVWVASFADDADTLAQFCKPLVSFLANATVRTPFSDWFDTTNAKEESFHNRTVQGGLFMPLLKRHWAEQGR